MVLEIRREVSYSLDQLILFSRAYVSKVRKVETENEVRARLQTVLEQKHPLPDLSVRSRISKAVVLSETPKIRATDVEEVSHDTFLEEIAKRFGGALHRVTQTPKVKHEVVVSSLNSLSEGSSERSTLPREEGVDGVDKDIKDLLTGLFGGDEVETFEVATESVEPETVSLPSEGLERVSNPNSAPYGTVPLVYPSERAPKGEFEVVSDFETEVVEEMDNDTYGDFEDEDSVLVTTSPLGRSVENGTLTFDTELDFSAFDGFETDEETDGEESEPTVEDKLYPSSSELFGVVEVGEVAPYTYRKRVSKPKTPNNPPKTPVAQFHTSPSTNTPTPRQNQGESKFEPQKDLLSYLRLKVRMKESDLLELYSKGELRSALQAGKVFKRGDMIVFGHL